MKLAATGHRPNKLNNEYDLAGLLSRWIKKQVLAFFDEIKPDEVISGMALGFDTLIALTALEKGIKVFAAIPCEGQEKVWPNKSQQVYKDILSNPLVTVKVVFPGPYHISKMLKRDEFMVDECDALIACWNGDTFGGTYHTYKYAKRKNKKIYRINPLGFFNEDL